MTKCPTCGKTLVSLNIQPMQMPDASGQFWRGITFNCPYCFSAVGAGIDPIGLKEDIVSGVLKALGKD
jgi:hypothetical protein